MKKQNVIETGISVWIIAALAPLLTLLPMPLCALGLNSVAISQSAPGEVQIVFQGSLGQIGALQSTAGFTSTWTTLGMAEVQSDGLAVFTDVVNMNSPGRFYRVVVPGQPTLSLKAAGNEDELFTVTLPPTNSLGGSTVAAFITQLPARGELFQNGGSAISNAPALVPDSAHRVQFRAAADENGSNFAAFRFVLQSSDGLLETGEATLDIRPVPDQPTTPLFWRLQTPEDTPIIFQVPVIDPDLHNEGDAITIRVWSIPPSVGTQYQVENNDQTRGAAIVTNNTPLTNPRGLLMFVPAPDFNLDAGIIVDLHDSYGLSNTVLGIIDVTPVNDPPHAFSKTNRARNTDNPFLITPSFGDVDGDALEVRLVSLPGAGQLISASTGNPANTNDWLPASQARLWLYYLPAPADCSAPIPTGTNIAAFTHIVRDPSNATATATETIDIVDFNALPTSTGPAAITNIEDAVLGSNTVPIVVSVFDQDNDAIQIQISHLPQHGRLYYEIGPGSYFEMTSTATLVPVILQSGQNAILHYVPVPDFNTAGATPDSFGFRAMDEHGNVSRCIGTVSLYVTAVPDAPIVPVGPVPSTPEDTPLIFQIPISDPDLANEGDTVRIYTDPLPCISPTAIDCAGSLYQVENDDMTRGTEITSPVYVTNPRGLVMFVPKHDWNGQTALSVRLEDSYGLHGRGIVLLQATPVNDPPVAASRTIQVPNTASSFLISPFTGDVDPGDSQALQVRLLSLPSAGRLTFESGAPANTNDWRPLPAAFLYHPPVPADCAEPIPTGTDIDSYTYIVRDPAGATATAREQIDIIDVNIPPVPTWPAAVTNIEDTTFEMATNTPIVIHLNDRDGDRVYFFVAQPPKHGRLYYQQRDETWAFVTSSNYQVLDTFEPGEHPHFFYVPDVDFNTDSGPAGPKPDSFSFRIMDWGLNAWRCEPVVNLYVNGVNDAPTLNAIADIERSSDLGTFDVQLTGIGSGAVNENQKLTINATASDLTIVQNIEVIYTSPETNGILRITPVPGATGPATITVVARDDGGTNYGGTDSITRTFQLTLRKPIP